MITIKDLNELSITQLQDTKVLIDTLVQNKIKREFKIGTKVNVVQKTKKTPGVITKIMQSKCLVDLSGRIYRVSMSMLEMRTERQLAEWDSKTKVSQGKKYIKVVQENGVFCFIVKEDFKHFKKGDILKAAGYNAPALNSARGNVLTGNYAIQWTGPLYLK